MNRTVISIAALLICCSGGRLLAQGGPPGASVSEVFSFVSQPGLLYAATNAGVFRSGDGGRTWTAQNQGLLTLDIQTVAGLSPDLLYAGTTNGGVFRSRSGGAWEAASQGLGSPVVLSLGLDPTDPNTVYAGTRSGGVFKTTDAGATWVAINNGLAQLEDGTFTGDYRDILVDPNDPQIVYAAHTSLVQPGTGILFKSVDGGQQWAGARGPAVTSLAFSPGDSQIVYLGTNVGLLRTTDGGESFEDPVLNFPSLVDVAVGPADPETIYVASRLSGIAKTSDGGENWELASAGLPVVQSFTLSVDQNDPAVLYYGANGAGLFRSSDRAMSWQLSSNGMNAADVRAIAVNPGNSSNVLASTFSGSVFQSDDSGDTWRESRDGMTGVDIGELAFDPQNPSFVYAGSTNPFDPRFGSPFFSDDGAFLRSTNGGATWEETVRPVGVTAIAVHPSDGRTVYLASDIGVFRSQDNGRTFEDRSSNELIGWDIVDLAIDPRRPQNLYAIATDPFSLFPTFLIFRTDDSGDDWDDVGGISTIRLNVIAVDPADSDRLYVGATGGFFRSGNRGRDFDGKNNGLPGDGAVIVTSIAIDRNDGGALYIAASGTVFKSTNRGDSWALADSGLGPFFVQSLAIDPQQAGVLYAATSAGGVFKTTDGGGNWTPTVASAGERPFIVSGGIVGGFDFRGGGVAAGEIVSIFGQDMGPAEAVIPGFDPVTGLLPTEVEGVTVFFDDTPAPLFFVREDQINAQAPFEIAGHELVGVRVVFNGTEGNRVSVDVVDTHPGVSPSILNQDFSLNSPENPAAPGSFILLFVTGQGLVDPEIGTGEPAPSMPPLPAPRLPVSVSIGGRTVSNVAAALAPGLVGLLQVNAQVEPETPEGANEVLITIGDQATEMPVTVYVE